MRSSEARTESVPVAAKDLVAGQRLLTIRPRSRLGKVTPSPFGVAAGIVFGDGCRPRSRDAAEVTLHGPKRQLVQFFQGCRLTTLPSGSIHITGLPGSFKSMIDLREGSSALYGWLAGYVATDGTISARGQVSLSSSRWEQLEFARTVATKLGIGVGDITTHFRVGLGRPEATALHTLRLQQPPLDLLVRDDQRNRWRPGASAVPSWTVRAIERHPAAPLWQLRTSSPASVVLDGYLVLPAGRQTGGASA